MTKLRFYGKLIFSFSLKMTWFNYTRYLFIFSLINLSFYKLIYLFILSSISLVRSAVNSFIVLTYLTILGLIDRYNTSFQGWSGNTRCQYGRLGVRGFYRPLFRREVKNKLNSLRFSRTVGTGSDFLNPHFLGFVLDTFSVELSEIRYYCSRRHCYILRYIRIRNILV